MDENTNTQSIDQQPSTQPAANGNQGNGKMFTQEEVNNIVRDRLARERSKNSPQEPTEEEKRLKDLTARESKLACREYVMEKGLPSQLLDVLDTSNHEEFKAKADIVLGLMDSAKITALTPDPNLDRLKEDLMRQWRLPSPMKAFLSGTSEDEFWKQFTDLRRIYSQILGEAPSYDPSISHSQSIGAGFKNSKHIPRQYPSFADPD